MLGIIVLSFREDSTIVLSPTTTTAQLQAALEAMPTAGIVAVETLDPTSADSLCLITGQSIVVTFKTVHGALPMIGYNVKAIDTFAITELAKGSKENDVCSNRGLCDHATGVCACFPGYGSSDGQGGPGGLHDCGYIEPVIHP